MAFLARRSGATRRAYQSDLDDFAAWLEIPSAGEAVRYLVERGAGEANELALTYKAALLDRGLSAGTVNRRLSTLRSVVKMARIVGLCAFTLEIESERAETYRDTRGPALDKIRELTARLQAKADAGSRLAVRDLAAVRLLFNLGLRRGEVVSLNLEHYEPEESRLSIQGKARAQREYVTLPATAKRALDAWVAVRGSESGPLFIPLDRAARHRGPGRLTATALWQMLGKHGIRPHGLRHSAITAVADRNGGDLFKTMSFSRHKSADVVTRYIDNLKDHAGEMAALLDDVA